MGRHRHAVTVRVDGLAAVLGPLLRDARVVAATLVDADSGMVLDTCTSDGWTTDLDMVGAAHAELARMAFTLPGQQDPEPVDELIVSAGPDRHHLLRAVPDPHGDRLVLSIVVSGSRRFAERARRRLRAVPVDALTAGPTIVRRPGVGGWSAPARMLLGSRAVDPIGAAPGAVTTGDGPRPAPVGVFAAGSGRDGGGSGPVSVVPAGGAISGLAGRPVGGQVRGVAPGPSGPHPTGTGLISADPTSTGPAGAGGRRSAATSASGGAPWAATGATGASPGAQPGLAGRWTEVDRGQPRDPGPRPEVHATARTDGGHPARPATLAGGPAPVTGPAAGAGPGSSAHNSAARSSAGEPTARQTGAGQGSGARRAYGPGHASPGRAPAHPAGTDHGPEAPAALNIVPARPSPQPGSLFEPVTPVARWPGPPTSEPARSGPLPPHGSPGGGSPPDRVVVEVPAAGDQPAPRPGPGFPADPAARGRVAAPAAHHPTSAGPEPGPDAQRFGDIRPVDRVRPQDDVRMGDGNRPPAGPRPEGGAHPRDADRPPGSTRPPDDAPVDLFEPAGPPGRAEPAGDRTPRSPAPPSALPPRRLG